MVGEDACYDLNFLKFTEVWFVTQDVVYPGECSMCTENKVYPSAFGWNVLKISMRSISSIVSFKTCVSLFIYVLMIFPLVWVGCISLLLLLCYCQFLLLCLLVFVLCIEVLLCWVHRYSQLLCLPLGLIPWLLCSDPSLSLVIFFILTSILSDMRIATPAIFCFPFAWNLFFPPLTLSLHMS